MSPRRPRPESGASPWYPKRSASCRRPGCEILVEAGAGAGSAIPDSAYTEAGATIVPTDALYQQSDVVLRVAKPSGDEVKRLRTGQAVVGFLAPLIDPALAKDLADAGRHGHQPRRDPADAVPGPDDGRARARRRTSAATRRSSSPPTRTARYFPLLTTAAGTAKPANVLILGIGVAGLQAIGTAKRLGAVVKAYDVRPETREQAESLGAQFVKLKTTRSTRPAPAATPAS